MALKPVDSFHDDAWCCRLIPVLLMVARSRVGHQNTFRLWVFTMGTASDAARTTAATENQIKGYQKSRSALTASVRPVI